VQEGERPEEADETEVLPSGGTSERVLEERPARLFGSGVANALQEFVRGLLAFTFAAILFFTVIVAFQYVDTDPGWNNTKELLQVLLPAETALLGAAIGFYFGSRPSR